MADYKAPLRDMRFVLNEVFEVATLWAPLQYALADFMADHPEHVEELPGFYQAKLCQRLSRHAHRA